MIVAAIAIVYKYLSYLAFITYFFPLLIYIPLGSAGDDENGLDIEILRPWRS